MVRDVRLGRHGVHVRKAIQGEHHIAHNAHHQVFLIFTSFVVTMLLGLTPYLKLERRDS